MKTIMSKLMIALLALIMALTLVACGPDEPDESSTPAGSSESTPEASSPDESSSEESVPESTPESSTPDADLPDVSPDGTPRPEDPTFESYTTDNENWVYEIEKTDVAIAIDGVMEKDAYYKGVYLVAEINMVASDSTFEVFMTADDTNIYVFYEFTKAEPIFWDETYAQQYFYHLDCADFVLALDGAEARGEEFRIMAGVEGGLGTAKEYDAVKYGVSDLYVKHTEKGYNVEFSIPLSLVTGKDENGNKMISFTALSTITTAWDDETHTEAPARKYPVACKAAGAEAKDQPSFLVVLDTAE